MKKVKQKEPIGIAGADFHLRPDTPICRNDDYMSAQESKIRFILGLGVKYSCSIFIAGDLGDKPLNNGWPTWLSAWFIDLCNEYDRPEILVVPGQHDLPGHNLDKWKEGGLGVLHSAGVINVLDKLHVCDNKYNLYNFPYGTEMAYAKPNAEKINIAIAHRYVAGEKGSWENEIGITPKKLLADFNCFDFIITGDNHIPILKSVNNKHLINCGSIMRMNADQIDHKPAVYLLYDDCSYDIVYLPIGGGVVERKHLEKKKERVLGFNNFIEHLQHGYETKLSFEKNMEKHLKINKVNKRVEEKIWTAMQ